jgi:hypothetical protein
LYFSCPVTIHDRSANLAVDALNIGLAFGIELRGLPGGPFSTVDALLASGTVVRSNATGLKPPSLLTSTAFRITTMQAIISTKIKPWHS